MGKCRSLRIEKRKTEWGRGEICPGGAAPCVNLAAEQPRLLGQTQARAHNQQLKRGSCRPLLFISLFPGLRVFLPLPVLLHLASTPLHQLSFEPSQSFSTLFSPNPDLRLDF